MEFIEQWWTSNPWLVGAGIAVPIMLFILWRIWHLRRDHDEIYLSDKDLYHQQYFDDNPIYRDDEIVDSAVLEFEKAQQKSVVKQPNETLKHNDRYDEPDYSDWEQVRSADAQKIEDYADAELEARIEAAAPQTKAKPKELIIAINIRAIRKQGFKGTDIFAAMDQLGIEHGKMSIFHHYGIEREATEYPVFSIANLIKPGTFNPVEQETFTTPGLIAFLQLPGSLGGRVAFELMLHYTQRLAEILQGHLEDDRKQPVDAELIDFMRKGIDEFERGV